MSSVLWDVFQGLVQDHGYGRRIRNLEDTYVRLEIFEEVSSTSGTLSVPTGASIVLDQFAQDVDALCTVVPASGQKPEEELERTAGGNLVTVTLSGTGNADFALSGTPVGSQYAIQYVVDIKFINLSNIDRDSILAADEVSEPFTVLKFDTTSTHEVEEGELAWGIDDGTLNLGMPGGNVVQQIGQEIYIPKRPKNVSGATMLNATVVYISGATTAIPEISLADASTELLSMATIGLTTEEIENNQRGYVTTFGLVRDVDTSAFASGATLWLSEVAGEFTDSKPSTPAHAVVIGKVNRVHATEGEILVNIANGWETYELHDVDDIIPTVNGQNWTWDVTAGYYKLRTSRLYNDDSWSFQPGADSTNMWLLKDQNGNTDVNYDSTNNIFTINGKLGLGIDAPVRRLHVYEAANNAGVRISSASNSAFLEMDRSSTNWDAYFIFQTASTPDWILGTGRQGVESNLSLQFYNGSTWINAVIFNKTTGDIEFPLDNIKTLWGTGRDFSAYYDGIDAIINPKEEGTGQLKILGHALFDTSHGKLYEVNGSTDITISTPGTYVQWRSTVVGLESGAGYVVGDTTNDRMTIGAKGAGRYKISYYSSVIAEPGQCLEAAVFKNGNIISSLVCRQTSADNPHVHADSVSLVTGTLISGTVANTKSWDGTYYVVQEVVATPGLVYDFTFTDAENLADIFGFRGRYNGSAVHNIKVQAYNNDTTTWDNLTAATDDLPSYVNLDYVKRFKITGTLSDYYNGSDQVKIRINHSSNGTTSHHVYNDEISMIREKTATILSFSDYVDLVATDYVDLRFTCPINTKVITPSQTNLSIERINR